MPSIKEKPEKSKGWALYLQNVWLFAGLGLLLAVAVTIGSFRLAALFNAQKVIGMRVVEASSDPILSVSGVKSGAYVAAKTGKSYYFPWCGAVNRIKKENLVWFPDRAAAEAFGYQPAGNCHGLK